MPRLDTCVGPLTWPTPVSLASGTCGWGQELDGLVDWSAVGAIFTKGLSLLPRTGHPPPRIWETDSGMLNAIGLENVGFEAFVADKMPFLRRYRAMHGGKVIVNLFGTTLEEYRELAERLDGVEGVDGVEINLSCPNVKAGGIEFGRTPEGCLKVTEAVRRASRKFVSVKLSPASSVVDVARASADGGADALCVGNTMPSMALDIERRVSRLSAGVGGLSGPALRPIMVRATYQIAQAVKIPIVGIGGVMNGTDAVEFMLAGAVAVQVGTATFADPNAAGAVRDGLVAYLERHQEPSAEAIVGTATV
jgi:dihydroorotate dehydrogenase (NAD+) catalytic subunit